jgi:DNA-binding sugar fermentation-stimulating protein
MMINSLSCFLQMEGVAEGSDPVVVHCPNTGPMTGLLDRPMAPCWLSTSSNAKRKYKHTLEAIQPEAGGAWVR